MTIPASELVDLQPRTLGVGSGGVDFNGLFISRNSNLPVDTVVQFSSADGVGDYFGDASEEYSLATNYFLADDNKQKSPTTLYFYRNTNADVSAFIRGAKVSAKISVFNAITDGVLNLVVDGAEVNITAIDLSSATSYSAIAEAINTRAGQDYFSYDANFGAFVVSSQTTGAESSVVVNETNIANDLSFLMNLTQSQGAVTSAGATATSLTQTMQNAIKKLQNFVSFMPVFQETDAEKLELAEWCNSKSTRFVYSATETNANALVYNNVSSFGQETSSYYGVLNNYNSKEFSAFAMGFIASIDFERRLGRKTFAYRSQSGLSYTVDDVDNAQALISNGYNFYGSYATASQAFTFAQPGQISGQAKWLDTYLGQIWLKTSLQSVWMTLMQNANILPFNSDGYNAVYAASMDVITSALNNGVIVKGVSLDNSQIDQVNREAGLDISDSLYTAGYYLQIPDASSQTRQDRGPLLPNLWYCDGGSIQSIKGTSTAIL